ncbi:DUF4037 domain-containing protein [Stackebrandtia nassauensis]|uniref:DUF4037 domain-containing protein n=1 Tax=Stackebrandtia nassauensis (strain DSM 44728 / CIP 108903 / NRRL B-16338 / NBRC 102104 / LLR-40K-21) TaxID=446470 RepID=D3Q2R3_STANL|nr:DUF4037 domain-containing protein [Stackebrandtia nassauensis]ADD45814.1 hypothetical protein Snas_6191 [Stackebrandtia nassauensis DSM 44728]
MAGEGEFLPGLELCRALYVDGVKPILESRYPDLRHSAARIGAGSEVQGFDTPVSPDHGWGPRLQLFLAPSDAAAVGAELTETLSRLLPRRIRGWSTHFAPSGDEPGASDVLADTDGPVAHGVEIADCATWFTRKLGVDATRRLDALEWLCVPQQYLAEATAGAVFHDGLGQLEPIRRRLTWYPEQVWRYLLASQWMKLSQEEAFVGRTAQVGDELGSMVVAARQVRELMRLALLQTRVYAPYSKWLGSAFARSVPEAAKLDASLRSALSAATYPERERHLCDAYEELARRHNALDLTPALDPSRRQFFDRPFQILGADRFANALRDSISHPELKRLPLTGAVDQWADNTDYIAQDDAIAASIRALRH